MCIVSNIGDYGKGLWPQYPPAVYPQQPVTFERVPTPEEWAEFLELVEKARKFDELTGEPDCEDPEKTAWMEAMQKHMDAVEALQAAGEALEEAANRMGIKEIDETAT